MNKTELTISLTLISVALINISTSQETTSYNVKVTEVTDGDTVKVTGDMQTTVRLLGVDTPETSSNNNPEEYGLRDTLQNRECLSRHGQKAAKYVKNQLNNKNITLRIDETADRRGDYGRLLAYINTGENQEINKKLLKNGLARVYTSDFSKLGEYQSIQAESKNRGKGIWSC